MRGLVSIAALILPAVPALAEQAPPTVDIHALFSDTLATKGVGLARKTKPVDVRPAKPGEVIVTVIAGEGKETESPAARSGDMVVRNRCPETGNEQILVAAKRFSERYDGPIGAVDEDGWQPYRPKGVDMRYFVVGRGETPFSFMAPWGSPMVARPGDAIVQNPADPADTYRIAAKAFACTYEILKPAP